MAIVKLVATIPFRLLHEILYLVPSMGLAEGLSRRHAEESLFAKYLLIYRYRIVYEHRRSDRCRRSGSPHPFPLRTGTKRQGDQAPSVVYQLLIRLGR
jgi:hypothetical protein